MTDESFVDRFLLLINELADGNKKRFAEMLRISHVNIHDWVNKGHMPKGEHLTNIQDKLKVSIDWLLTGKGERYIKQDLAGEVRETVPLYGMYLADGITDEEKAYLKKLIRLFHTKQEKTVVAIKQNIDAFLDTPNKTKAKKNVSNG